MSPLSRRSVAIATFAAAAVALLATLVRSDDPDMFHHLALGREIARSGLFSDERFVYPVLGQPIGIPRYWLGSLALYGWHVLFGDGGMSFLPACLGALLCAILLLDAAPRGARHGPLTLAAAALPIALAIETFRYRAVPRTELFGAVLLALTMWAIHRFEDGRPRALVAFPLVAALWTNLHPSTAVALVAIAVLVAAGAAATLAGRSTGVARADALPPRRLALAAGVLAAGFLASGATPGLANPVWPAIRFALAAMGIGGAAGAPDPALADVSRAVVEMRGGGARLWASPVGALLAVTAASLLLRGRQARLREVATVALFAILPFAAVRFAVFFAIVAAPVAARGLGEALSALPGRAGGFPARAASATALVAAAVASTPLGMLAPNVRFGSGIDTAAFPVRGADYLAAIGFSGRLFNTFHMGGYLEWRGVGPPFQDGRGVPRPEDAAGAHAGPHERAAFAPLDARWRFDALLVSYPAVDPALARFMDPRDLGPDPERWALVAFDDGGLLYLRRDGRYAQLAGRDEYREATPASPVLAPGPRGIPALLADWRRSVFEAPPCSRCRIALGEVALAAGLPDEAAAAAAAGLARARGPERAALASIAARAAAAERERPAPGGPAVPASR